MTQVVVIGCGVIGAAIAYELSLVPGLKITVLDRQQPAQGATGAALGVLMGAISKKTKGRAWQLRQSSMQRYETLIPELETLTQLPIPFNRQGILMLCFDEADLTAWQPVVETRASQGWHLEIWDKGQVQLNCPQLQHERMVGAIYSPQDRQVDPVALTSALIAAAQKNGVIFKFGVAVEEIKASSERLSSIQTTQGKLNLDWLVVASGLGSTLITTQLKQPINIKPVLGQALQLQLIQPMGKKDFQPVITGDDIHLVPLGKEQYWVGATVEFTDEAESVLLEQVLQEAIAFCPSLAEASIIKTWIGKRPRPDGRPAPVIEKLAGYRNILLATGHYRNGVLLAPATATAIREMITATGEIL
jgi:glycine oxidase ThiO